MKKILSLIALLGIMVGSASAAPYYLPQPASGALTSYDWQPVYTLEGVYNFVDKHDLPDTYGARLNFSLYSDAVSTVRHQFGCNIGYEYGSKHDLDLTRIPLTLGYDANIALTDHVLLDLGGKVGYAWAIGEEEDIKETCGGFTFSLGAGIKVLCSDSIYVKVGYEFSRTFLQDVVDTADVNFGQHSIVVAVGAKF